MKLLTAGALLVASAFALVAGVLAPASAAPVPPKGPGEISLDMPWSKGKGPRNPPLCYRPCTVTATVPAQNYDGSPFVLEPSGRWGGNVEFGPENEDRASLDFGPASTTFTTTITKLGLWSIDQTAAGTEDTYTYDQDGNLVGTIPGREGYSQSSTAFLVLSPKDKRAPIKILSSREGLRVGSLVRVKSNKKALTVVVLFKNGGEGEVRPTRCKHAAGVRCFKIAKMPHGSYPPTATLIAKGWNPDSMAYKLDDVLYGDNVEDTARVKVSFRCKRRWTPTGRRKICG